MKKTIQELFGIIDNYMSEVIDGANFNNEQDFENEIRAMLEKVGFDVIEKHNVNNIQKMLSEGVGDIEDQIPDIAVQCTDGLVFLELKFCATPQDYESDLKKVWNYVNQGKCDVGGVLFLDKTKRQRWKICQANNDYNYYLGWTK